MREPLTVLLDQNVPQKLALWLKLKKLKPSRIVYHTSELNLAGKSDEDVFTVGQERHTVIVTCKHSSASEPERQPAHHAAADEVA